MSALALWRSRMIPLLDVTAEQVTQQAVNGIARGGYYALVAVGYTLVYGVLQLINFAHSEVFMLGAYSAWYPARMLGYVPEKGGEDPKAMPFGILTSLILFAMAVCALIGALIELAAYRPLRKAGKLAPLITAIGVSLFLQYGAQLVFSSQPKSFPSPEITQGSLQAAGVSVAYSKIAILLVAGVLMAGLWLFVQRSRPGRAMRAVSHDMRVAQLMGINVNRTISLTFALGSALAAVGGVLVAVDQPSITPFMGAGIGLKAFVAAVLGGIGSIPGAVLGAVLLGLAEGLVSAWSTNYADAVAFLILVVVLLVRPAGLLGSSAREKV